MFRLVSLNLNGIRSAASKGFEAWAEGVGADCMGVQEIKAQAPVVEGRFDTVAGLQGHFHYAERPGYAGVGLYSRRKPSAIRCGFGDPEFDAEGRWVECRFDRATRRAMPKLSIVSCYFPSGSSGEHRQQAKFRFLEKMAPYMHQLAIDREVIVVGDINIAHKEIDLKNWRGNRKNSGFLPEERAWMTRLFDELGYVDVFRQLNPHPEQYTWWSNRGQARAKNVGWRLDYHLATPGVAALATREHIYLEKRFSDHAPVVIEYDFNL
ncbi:exodeoxyribonuclease III [Piscinibacter koreensis]|uniref:Exodeoxyribonuclease III n=1 Tax=Piscinibacter koreensis TaxID=2742824 RepID=A0A7Y6NJP4_9BURK|nr:exodeoxyribonuclease III [Schlegelella koreensis]